MGRVAHSGLDFVPTRHNDIHSAIDPAVANLSQPGKMVLITGSGRGIGRSMALRYAQADVACIAICSRTASELDAVEVSITRTSHGKVRVRKYNIDITKPTQVPAMAADVMEKEGRLDILVNNAGTSSVWKPIGKGLPEDFMDTFTTNIQGTYLVIKSFIPLLVSTARTHNVGVDVVNIASMAAHYTMPGASAYQISKLALLRLTEFVQAEYGVDGVNCMAVHPGSVITKMTRKWPREMLIMMGDSKELCAGFVVWLTKGNRTWLSGRYVSANWDVDELEAKKDEILGGDKLKIRMVV
jgi:NAD(P)-dependent dehydrogenase (short-subunit alcohol dehydrogenase family)